ncbi:MAG: ABC transporter ATP-binding protein [Candidatus Latescibacteria bacterium]|nr:ABC transporter ATP-binding protein [Candidatus Latescibacterota bacterium]
MSDIAIRVETLGKLYRIGRLQQAPYKTLRETLMNAVSAQWGWFSRNGRSAGVDDTIWALKDVSFEVTHGEIIGLIGRNGAGKSTLLKILSRITEPTEGYAEIHGRVSSLLEVGTGFHGELTGRENIYLNGAILGMKKTEINRKFDEIVAFAEVERFIDTPVKHYSSGMHVRLAFAVAAHLEPEILLADEVLAVGDTAFREKCLEKMGDIAREGRTVLFVSHNTGAIIQICPTSILLQQGRVAARGPSTEIVSQYLAGLSSPENSLELGEAPGRSGDGRLRFVTAYLRDESGKRTKKPIAGHPVDVVLEFVSSGGLSHVRFMLTVFNHMGIAVTHCHVDAFGQRFRVAQGEGRMICHIPKLPLPRGQYRISIMASDDIGQLDRVPTACVFNVEASNFFPTPYTPRMQSSTALVEHSWQLVMK